MILRCTRAAALLGLFLLLGGIAATSGMGPLTPAVAARVKQPKPLFVEPANLLKDLKRVKLESAFLASMEERLGVVPKAFRKAYSSTGKELRRQPIASYVDQPGGRDALRAAFVRTQAGKLNVSPAALRVAMDATLRAHFQQSLESLVASGQLSPLRRDWHLERFDLHAGRTAGLLE